MQVPAGGPQLSDAVSTTQTAPRQQPPEQDVASHLHTPFMQRCPSTHAGPPPHRHAPVAEQLSLVLAPHATQAPPAGPQAATERG